MNQKKSNSNIQSKRKHPVQKKRKQHKPIGPLLFVLCLITIAGIYSFKYYMPETAVENFAPLQFIEEISTPTCNLSDYVSETASIDTYYVYGTSFNLSGSLETNTPDSIDSVTLLLCPSDHPDYSAAVDKLDLLYSTTDNTVSFSTSDYLNDGLCFERIPKGEYVFLIALNDTMGQCTLYSLLDQSNEKKLIYYTLTHKSANRCLIVSSHLEETVPYMELTCKSASLPDEVYDIVLDPGHGGKDCGAQSKDKAYDESTLMLEYAKSIKSLLEAKGYKVLLTRDGSEAYDAPMAYNMYDPDGRINVACASKAKFAFSLHLNSNDNRVDRGTQIYLSAKSNDTFAKQLADTIVSSSNLSYSGMDFYKRTDGVYSRTYLESDLEEAVTYAAEHGFEPYENMTTSTDFFFILRELGGIATEAHTDGRNPLYGTNLYYNANWGLETYLCEWGYISDYNDLQIILNDKDTLQNAFVTAVCNHIDELYY